LDISIDKAMLGHSLSIIKDGMLKHCKMNEEKMIDFILHAWRLGPQT
jgi:hypothetical protein